MNLPPPGFGADVDGALWTAVDDDLPNLVDLYKWFHAHPELSFKEAGTSKRMAGELKSLGCEVVQGIAGTGVVGLLRNGPGPWVLARADMDALPVLEETGLPYASRGGVMHACGHDSHMAIVVGAARALLRLKDRWSGTLVLVGQPAEEIGSGAKRMLEDPRFHQAVAEKPTACLSIHDFPTPAGTLGVTAGYASANVDNLDLTIYGRGGHGAWPHLCVDPVVIGAEVVLALQTIVARKVEPGIRAIVTVGAFNAGAKHNVIPDEAALKLTVRSYDDKTRAKLLDEILHLATQVCAAHRSPKPPQLREADDFCPAGYHDPAFTQRIRGVFERLVGPEKVYDAEPMMGGEDFSRFPLHWKVPGLQFRVGGARPNHDRAVGLHSSKWAVDPEPTLRTGATALARAMLEVLGPKP